MNRRKFLCVVLTVFIMVSQVFTFGSVGAGDVKIDLFGEMVTLPEGYGTPFIDPNTSRTLVPARGVFEAMDATVTWVAETRTVVINGDDAEIKITIDSTTAYKNNEAVTLDQPAVILSDSRTYIPLRFVAESLNLKVDFDGKTTTVIIKDPLAENSEYPAGTYKTGRQIKEGEYLFVATADNSEVKLLRDKDSSKTENVISKISFKNSAYVSIIGTEYIEAVNCKIYPIDKAPARAEGGVYKNGMFKVGKDFAAGTYKVKRIVSTQKATYKVYSTPFSTAGTNTVKSEGTVTTDKNITLVKDQYITVENAQLTLVSAAQTPVISGGSSGGGGGGSRPSSGGGGSSRPSSGGSSSGGGSKATAEPTEVPGDNSTPAPTAEPTEEPTLAPTPAPTLEPEIEDEFYEGFEDEVTGFGYTFDLPAVYKEVLDDTIIYSYDISYFMSGNKFDRSTVFDRYIMPHLSRGFGTDVFENQDKNEFHLENKKTGVFVHIEPDYDAKLINVTVYRDNSSIDSDIGDVIEQEE